MKRLLFLILLGVIGAWIVRSYLFEGIYLKTGSMEPTMVQGAHVVVNKLAYVFRKPKRGEIILLHAPQQPDPNKDLVKRVIAVEGDEVAVTNKRVVLNQQVLDEPYTQFVRPNEILEGDNRPPVKVPKDCVVVMGDNRDVSGDSRDWTDKDGKWNPFVCGPAIQGRVVGFEM